MPLAFAINTIHHTAPAVGKAEPKRTVQKAGAVFILSAEDKADFLKLKAVREPTTEELQLYGLATGQYVDKASIKSSTKVVAPVAEAETPPAVVAAVVGESDDSIG
jgi:hypothetical protein